MKTLRFSGWVSGFAAAAMLAGCGGSGSSAGSLTPAGRLSPRFSAPLRQTPTDAAATKGIYVSPYQGGILGYRIDRRRAKDVCTVKGIDGAEASADRQGNLIATGPEHSITVFQGPRLCGPKLGSLSDPFGGPIAAASADAATGPIVVANIYDTSDTPGSLSICTLSGGCAKNLTNAAMDEVAGVALAKNGDCWASAVNSAGKATLTYFKLCSGAGEATTGFMNSDYGSLDIDTNGNLVSVDYAGGKLWVYSGCDPRCAVVGGPFALRGDSVVGHLNEDATQFAAADFSNGDVDVYRYRPSRLTHEYSFAAASQSVGPLSAAYSPSSKE
jgi:hypothetical protein